MKYIFIILFFIVSTSTFSQTLSLEKVVQKQVEAYNNKDINAFLDTYSDTIKVYAYPNTLQYEGKEKMRAIYSALFDETSKLHCEIKKRIVLENKVIDEELVQFDELYSSCVAIYEIENNKITRVTFVR